MLSMATNIMLAKHTSTYRLALRYNYYDLIVHMLKLLQLKAATLNNMIN